MALGRLPERERVVAVGVRSTTRNGGEVLLSSITFWSDRLCLHYGAETATHPPAEPVVRTGIVPSRSVTDDVGTRYQVFSAGHGGNSPNLVFGAAWFQPAVPAHARWLYVSSPELLEPIEVSIERGPV